MDVKALEHVCAVTVRLFERHRIIAAYAFGSRMSGRPSVKSDLDVGYYLEGYTQGELLSIHEEMVLAADLSDVLGYQVDLRNLAEAPLELRGQVLEEGVRIYSGNDSKRVDLECDVLARYHDYKETYKQMHEIRLRQMATRAL